MMNIPILHCPQVADGKIARSRFAKKFVYLSPDSRCIAWDGGKKMFEISAVLRISVGLESRTLQRLYGSGAAADSEIVAYHWFSFHTASRSYDFGAKDCGDESKTLLLWVFTVQQLLAPFLPRESVQSACCALSQAHGYLYEDQRLTSHFCIGDPLAFPP